MRKQLQNMQVIIFDLDGTLWDASECARASWQHVVKQQKPDLRQGIAEDEMRSYMGMPVDEICERLFPELTPAERDQLLCASQERQHQMLCEAGDKLYPQVRETLHQLAGKYKLAIASNCVQGYIETFLAANGLAELFCDFECWGNTGRSKGENLQLMMERNNWQADVCCMVGDTDLDQQAAAFAGMPFFYARYGFGSVREFDYAINSFDELLFWL